MSARRFEGAFRRKVVRHAVGWAGELASIGGELPFVERHARGVPRDALEGIGGRRMSTAGSANGGAVPAPVPKVEHDIAALQWLEVLEHDASEQAVARSGAEEPRGHFQAEALYLDACAHTAHSPHLLREGALQLPETTALDVHMESGHGRGGLEQPDEEPLAMLVWRGARVIGPELPLGSPNTRQVAAPGVQGRQRACGLRDSGCRG